MFMMAGGDGRYDPADAPSLINALVTEHVDMVVGTRRGASLDGGRAQPVGNSSCRRLYRMLFGGGFADIFSGYRAFTRRFVKSFPAVSTGLEIETEMSVHAAQLMIPVAEIDLGYGGSANGVQTPAGVGDGLKTLRTFATLAMEARRFLFFSALAILFWVAGVVLIAPAAATFMDTGAALPAFVLGTGLFIIGFFLAGCGLVLDGIGQSRIEQKRILFLSVPGLGVQ